MAGFLHIQITAGAPLNFQAFRSEIQEQSNIQFGGCKIVDQLDFMSRYKSGDSF
jgi:hypothetical protein